jgi:hypothetical protein
MFWLFPTECAVDLVEATNREEFRVCMGYNRLLVTMFLPSTVQLQPLPRKLLPYISTRNPEAWSKNTACTLPHYEKNIVFQLGALFIFIV